MRVFHEMVEIYIVLALVAGLAGPAYDYFIENAGGMIGLTRTNLSFFTFEVGLLFLFIIYEVIFKGRNFRQFGFSIPSAEHLKTAVSFFGFFFLFAIATRLMLPDFDAWYIKSLGITGIASMNYVLISVLPLALIAEELAFRGYVQSKLQLAFRSSGPALLAAALAFTTAHFSYYFIAAERFDYFLAIMLTVFGYALFLTYLYQITRSIFATILVHFLTNYFSISQTYFHANGDLLSELFIWLVWAALFGYFLKSNMHFIGKMGKMYLKQAGKISSQQFLLLIIAAFLPAIVIWLLRLR